MGPMIDEKAAVNTQAMVDEAVDRGAAMLTGGEHLLHHQTKANGKGSSGKVQAVLIHQDIQWHQR